VETYPFKNPPPRGGKAKGSASLRGKLQQDASGLLSPDLIFPSACSSWCQEVLGYLPPTADISQGFFLATMIEG
jgi:hypothetical protein